MNYPALVFWVVIAGSAMMRPSTILVLLLASVPFASLALLPPDMIGGLSILPQEMFAVVLMLKVLAPEVMAFSPKLLNALRLRNLGCLALFLLVGIIATLIMPRLFQGDIVVVPMHFNGIDGILAPVAANFTQAGYVTMSVVTTIAVALMVDDRRFVRTLLLGMLAGGLVCLVTGLIDMAAASAGLENLLQPFRNAGYAYLTDTDISGVRRVVGFTPEASAYGPICVEFAASLVFLRDLYPSSRQRVLAVSVAISLIVLALQSTSSTAYGGLAVLALMYAVNFVRRAIVNSPFAQRSLLWELLLGFGVIIALLVILIVRANLLDPLINLVNEQILNKPSTGSFVQRSHWNSVAWDAVGSTIGLGIGFGSTRASSWVVAVVSNVGVIGAAFMGIFLLQTFFRRASSRDLWSEELMSALKFALLPALAMIAINEPGPDFGLWMSVVFGMITGVGALQSSTSSILRVSASRQTRGWTPRRQAPFASSGQNAGPGRPPF